MFFQEGAQGAGFFHAGDHPEGVLEHVPILLIGKGIVAIGVIVGDEVEEGFHVGLMHEVSDAGALRQRAEVYFGVAGPGAEEFVEVEGGVLSLEAVGGGHGFLHIEGEDPHFREGGVGIVVGGMVPGEFIFPALLHHVVPGVDIFFEASQQVVRGAGEGEDFRLFAFFRFFQKLLHGLA